MVVKHWKGQGRVSKEGTRVAVGKSIGGSRFTVLMEEEDLGEGGKSGEIKVSNLVSDLVLEKRKSVEDLDSINRQSKGKDKQSNRQIKKKGIIIGGSNSILKIPKPIVGRLGIQRNKVEAPLIIG